MIAARIVFDRFPALTAQAIKQAEQAVRKAAFDVEGYAKSVVPVDTGALKASIRTDFPGALSAEVSANMSYSIFVELGTRHQVAQPFMTPAAEHVRPAFVEAMRSILG